MKKNEFLRWMSGNTESIYWHDSAQRAEQEEGFFNGAAGMTTNPFLINAALNNNRDFWLDRLSLIPKGLEGDEKVLALMHCVTQYYANLLMPIYNEGNIGKGYVCAQTNPNKTGDTKYIVEQAKILASWSPNIVIKLPATRAGIEAYEECVALGFNTAATIGFTVPQALLVAEARKRGKLRAEKNGIKPGLSIAVIMVGRLDDYLRDVAQDSYKEIGEEDVIQAGTACIKRAYGIFNERGYDTFLMPAGSRGAYNITEIAGGKMIMSIAPKIALMLEKVNVFEERIDVPVDAAVIDRLMKMKEFRKAYEPDGMKAEEFITFGSTNRTTAQFIECGWNPLTMYRY